MAGMATLSFVLVTVSAASSSAQNQRQKTIGSPTTSDAKRDKLTALFDAYEFDEAVTLIEKEIKTAQRTGKPTAALEDELRQARLGATMLKGTEKVFIVDSLVVPRATFLQAYKLSRECGIIGPLASLVPALSKMRCGQTAHINDLGDRIVFSAPDSAGRLKLQASDRLGNQWSQPRQLSGMGQADDIQDYPYMMADGTTLYYAAQSSESLGGYDIFVTRYNNATGQYVKAENVGMPFNSPANDYLMVIDEGTGIGWFVSDRRQPADKVCIYRFIPNVSKEVYDYTPENEAHVRRLARIASLAESQTDTKVVAQAKARLLQSEQAKHNATSSVSHYYVIDDATVYTSTSQFRNATARRLAQETDALRGSIDKAEERLEQLRTAVDQSKSNSAAAEIGQLEQQLPQLYTALKEKEKAMRRAELGSE